MRLTVDVRGFHNIEMEVSQHLRVLKKRRIEEIDLDDKGRISIRYSKRIYKYLINYSVKQVSKKKYKSLDEFIEKSFNYKQSGIDFLGLPRLKKKWVIELENVWLVFFEH